MLLCVVRIQLFLIANEEENFKLLFNSYFIVKILNKLKILIFMVGTLQQKLSVSSIPKGFLG